MRNTSMIDSTIYLDSHKIITERRLTMSEDVFRDHFPLFPILPGVLLLEMVTESISSFLDSNQYALIEEVYFEKIRFQNYARPGDCIKAEILLKKETKEEYVFVAGIKTDEKNVAKIKKIRILKKEG